MNKRIPILCVFFFLLNGAFNLNWAQSTLTLQEAIDKSSTTHPLIKSVEETSEIKAQAFKLTNKALLPEVNLYAQASLGTFNNITGMYIPQNGLWPISGPPSDDNNGQAAWGSVAGAGFSWEPFTFGERKNKIQQAAADYQSSRRKLELVRFNHLSNVIYQYLTTLAAQKNIEALQANLERAEEVYKTIYTLTVNELRPGVDTALAQAEVSRAKINAREAQKSFHVAQARLAELINMNDDFQLAEAPFYTELPAQELTEPPVHPLIQVYESRLAYDQLGVESTKKVYFPEIRLTGTYYVRGSGVANDLSADHTAGAGFNFERYNYGIGLALSLPILDYAQYSHQIKMQESQLSASRFALESQELAITQQLRSASEQLEYALFSANETPVQLRASQYAYEMMHARYESGLVNFQELVQTQYLLTEAEVNDINGRIAAWQALLQQAAASGDLSIFLNQIQ